MLRIDCCRYTANVFIQSCNQTTHLGLKFSRENMKTCCCLVVIKKKRPTKVMIQAIYVNGLTQTPIKTFILNRFLIRQISIVRQQQAYFVV